MAVASSNLCCGTTYLSQHRMGLLLFLSPHKSKLPTKIWWDNKTPENITPTDNTRLSTQSRKRAWQHTRLRFRDKSEFFSFHETRSLKIILGKFLLACKCNYAYMKELVIFSRSKINIAISRMCHNTILTAYLHSHWISGHLIALI